MEEVGVAVVIPKGAWVFPTGTAEDSGWSGPRAGHLRCGGDEDAFVGRGEIDVEEAVVLTHGRSPHAAAVTRAALHVILRRHCETREDVTGELPVHEIRSEE